jgi:hypothetical protein
VLLALEQPVRRAGRASTRQLPATAGDDLTTSPRASSA